jgi:hypothetical protein
MSSKIYIPKRIKIGFQSRDNTLAGNLAYIIYFDEKNKLRKQVSWDNWRNHDIEPVELDNTPRNGYVVNQGITHFSYSSFGSDRFRVRIHSPEGYEFEIYPENFLAIVAVSDISKRYINQECVFAWDGTEMLLLPTNTEQYQEAVANTKKMNNTKDMLKAQKSQNIHQVGNIFVAKSGTFMYVGHKDIITASKCNINFKPSMLNDDNTLSLTLKPESIPLGFSIYNVDNSEVDINQHHSFFGEPSEYSLSRIPQNAIFEGKNIDSIIDNCSLEVNLTQLKKFQKINKSFFKKTNCTQPTIEAFSNGLTRYPYFKNFIKFDNEFKENQWHTFKAIVLSYDNFVYLVTTKIFVTKFYTSDWKISTSIEKIQKDGNVELVNVEKDMSEEKHSYISTYTYDHIYNFVEKELRNLGIKLAVLKANTFDGETFVNLKY